MYVAVARDKFQRGIRVGRPNDVTPAFYEVLTLDDALAKPYDTDAHMVGYIVRPDRELPVSSLRVCKGSEHLAPGPIEFWTVLVDVDNAGHAPWTPELRAQADALWASKALESAYVYMTKNGWRYAQPYTAPLPTNAAELAIRGAWTMLLELGVTPDTTCRDWTRHMRMPNVMRRDGALPAYRYTSPYLKAGFAIEPPVFDPNELPPAEVHSPRKRRAPQPTRFAVDVPKAYADLPAQLGRELSALAQGWHKAYLAVSGALLSRGVPPEAVPAIIHAAAIAEGSHKPDDHRRAAIDTARRWAEGGSLLGARYLQEAFPNIALTLERHFAKSVEDGRVYTTADEAAETLKATLRNAPPGVTLISATCGVGKTHATREVFSERVATAAKGKLHRKAVLSVPTHALAVQVQQDLRKAGIEAQRWFSPVSLKDAGGQPVCIHADKAAPLVAGGQSIQKLFCETCTVKDVCPARAGVEGAGAIVIGAHPRLRALAEEAGSGLLVVDEPPQALTHTPLTQAQLTAAIAQAPLFQGSYGPTMAYAFLQVGAFLASAKDREPRQVRTCFPSGLPALLHPPAPPLTRSAVALARSDAKHAALIGEACGMYLLLYNAHRYDGTLTRTGDRLTLTVVHDGMRAACDRTERIGPTVLLDANADLRRPEVTLVSGYDPNYVEVFAKDAGPVERTRMLVKATRTRWLKDGKVQRIGAVLDALRAAVAWTRGHPGPIAIIAWKALELELGRALAGHAKAWRELQDIVVPAWTGALLGHYGAVRGLDHMRGAHQLVTVGDPWPELFGSAHHALTLGIAGDDLDARALAEATAELEQAHGRLRLPRRTRSARALHVGTVVPGGYGWANAEVIACHGGHTMTRDELHATVRANGGADVCARKVGHDARNLHACLRGDRPIPAALVAKLRSLLAEKMLKAP